MFMFVKSVYVYVSYHRASPCLAKKAFSDVLAGVVLKIFSGQAPTPPFPSLFSPVYTTFWQLAAGPCWKEDSFLLSDGIHYIYSTI